MNPSFESSTSPAALCDVAGHNVHVSEHSGKSDIKCIGKSHQCLRANHKYVKGPEDGIAW